MVFKNIEFHNVSELTPCDGGGYLMHRFPVSVEEKLEGGAMQNKVSTGVELRFKIRSGAAKIKLKNASDAECIRIYQYRGSVVDAWQCYTFTLAPGAVREIAAEPHSSPELLSLVNREMESPFSHEVIRLVFNSSSVVFLDAEGDIVPPEEGDLPKRTYLAYGSSITNGSHSYAPDTKYVFRVASRFFADARNLGLSGNARLEAAVADEIAEMGKRGEWDFASVCLGINVTYMTSDEFRARVRYMLTKIVSENPKKHVFAISPFYAKFDMQGEGKLSEFRSIVEEEAALIASPYLHYVNGLSLLGGVRWLSGDFVHPTQAGADEIAKNLIREMEKYITR